MVEKMNSEPRVPTQEENLMDRISELEAENESLFGQLHSAYTALFPANLEPLRKALVKRFSL